MQVRPLLAERNGALCLPCIDLEDTPFYVDGEGCVESCPKYVRFYFADTQVCTEKCSLDSLRAVGTFACEPAPKAIAAAHSVSVAGNPYNYLYRQTVSYAALDWNVQTLRDSESVAVFLETRLTLIGLRLRVTTQEDSIGYAPVVFIAAKVMVASELQLTAKTVTSFAVLAAVLLRDTSIICSYIFADFAGTTAYPIALWAGEHIAMVVRSTIEVGGKAIQNGILYV